MSSPEAASDELRGKNSSPSVLLWLLATLSGSILLAWIFGKADPRIKLLGLFPLALGALTAFLSVELLRRQNLFLRKPMIAWMTAMALIVSAGATYQSSRDWHDEIWEDRKGVIGENAYQDYVEMRAGNERDERFEYFQTLESKTSFEAYLSHRLKAFSEQLGREYVWDSPVPEVAFGIEQLLAASGGLIVSIISFRSQRRSAHQEASAS